jgi:hypothetical protein
MGGSLTIPSRDLNLSKQLVVVLLVFVDFVVGDTIFLDLDAIKSTLSDLLV